MDPQFVACLRPVAGRDIGVWASNETVDSDAMSIHFLVDPKHGAADFIGGGILSCAPSKAMLRNTMFIGLVLVKFSTARVAKRCMVYEVAACSRSTAFEKVLTIPKSMEVNGRRITHSIYCLLVPKSKTTSRTIRVSWRATIVLANILHCAKKRHVSGTVCASIFPSA